MARNTNKRGKLAPEKEQGRGRARAAETPRVRNVRGKRTADADAAAAVKEKRAGRGASAEDRLYNIEKSLRELSNILKEWPPQPGDIDERLRAWSSRVNERLGE